MILRIFIIVSWDAHGYGRSYRIRQNGAATSWDS